MKVLLIQPNPRYCHGRVVCAAAPLGLLYLAAALRRAGFSEVRLLDARLHDLNRDQVAEQVKAFAPDLAGITGMTVEAPEIHALARLVKSVRPACRIAAGGAHAGALPEEMLANPAVDYVVIGEGDETLCELVSALRSGSDLRAVRGLAYRRGGSAVVNPPRLPVEDVDSLPFPAWDLAELETRNRLGGRHSVTPFPLSRAIAPLLTSRGCPYGCIFCHNIFGKKARLRSPAGVVDEIELLVRRYGVREIEILDDIFNWDPARAKAICDEICRRGLKIGLTFPNGLRADRMDEELVLKLKAAGAYLLIYAVESGSPEMQRRIGKNLDLVKAGRIIRFTIEQRLLVGGFFMLGFPGETEAQMLETIKFAWKFPFYQAYFFYLTPWPGSGLYERQRPAGAAAGVHDHLNMSLNLSAVPDARLQELMNGACKGYYRRPRLLWQLLSLMPARLAWNILMRSLMPRDWAYRNLP